MKYTEEDLHINEKMVLRVSATERRKKITQGNRDQWEGKVHTAMLFYSLSEFLQIDENKLGAV